MNKSYELIRVGKAFYFTSSLLLAITSAGLFYFGSVNAVRTPKTFGQYETQAEHRPAPTSKTESTSTIDSKVYSPP